MHYNVLRRSVKSGNIELKNLTVTMVDDILSNANTHKGSWKKAYPHSFRFTYVTRMRRGLSAETVQKLAGHSSVEMTEYYTRAAIPEMVAGLKDAVPAANMLFE